jgi:hypothetical protein
VVEGEKCETNKTSDSTAARFVVGSQARMEKTENAGLGMEWWNMLRSVDRKVVLLIFLLRNSQTSTWKHNLMLTGVLGCPWAGVT